MINISSKKILVTGGAGFIGSHTVDALIKKGGRVIVVDNLVTGRKENLNPKARFYQLDCASPKLAAIFAKEKPDYVYHFAFNVQVPKSITDPLMDAQSIIASLNVIANAHRAGVKKIIFASSGFLYGNANTLPVSEEGIIDPVTPYVVSKHAVENYLRYYKKTFGLSYVIFRYASIYGPRQVMGAMADYIRQLKAGKQAKIWGDGTKTRDYVFVDDVVRANLLALAVSDDFPNPLFNVGSAKETTLNTLYQTIADILGKSAKPIYLADLPADQIRYCLAYAKIKKTVGWKPEVSLQEGLRQVIAHFTK